MTRTVFKNLRLVKEINKIKKENEELGLFGCDPFPLEGKGGKVSRGSASYKLKKNKQKIMSEIKIKGKIKLKKDEEKFGEKEFRKRLLVLETEEKYPQLISIEFTQDRCDLLDKVNEGDVVDVWVNLRGREWVNPEGETRYFNSINGWRIALYEEDVDKDHLGDEDDLFA